jgi:hypothetical protein
MCSSSAQCQRGSDATYQACKANPDAAASGLARNCATKSLFEPFIWQDAAGMVGVFVGGSIAAGAGIGGGGLYVPLFVLLGWGKQSVERSLGATTGLSCAMMIMIAPKRHPEVSRPLIDYRAILLLEPIVLLGTVPGKILNKIFPSMLIYICLLILLMTVCTRTWQKYFKFKKRDKERAEERAKKTKSGKPAPEAVEAKVQKGKSLYLDTDTGSTRKGFSASKVDERKEEEAAGAAGGGAAGEGSAAAKSGAAAVKPTEEGAVDLQLTDPDAAKEVAIDDETGGEDGNKDKEGDVETGRPAAASSVSGVSMVGRLGELRTDEAAQPYKTIALLCLCWAFVLGLALAIKYGLVCGADLYWVFQLMNIPFMVIFTACMGGALYGYGRIHGMYGRCVSRQSFSYHGRTLECCTVFIFVYGGRMHVLCVCVYRGGGVGGWPATHLTHVTSSSSSSSFLWYHSSWCRHCVCCRTNCATRQST